jgi:hypothetical protein
MSNDKIKVETAKRTQEEIDAYRAKAAQKMKAEKQRKTFITIMAIVSMGLLAASLIIRAMTP